MLDLKFIRANAEAVKAGAAKKRITCDVDGLLALDEERRALAPRVDELRSRQKSGGKEMAKAGPEERANLLGDQKRLKEELSGLETTLSELEKKILVLQLRIPNVPAAAVPSRKFPAPSLKSR